MEEGDDAEYFVFSIGCQVKPSSIVRVALFNWNLRVRITSRLLNVTRSACERKCLGLNSVAQKNQNIFVWLTKLFNKLSTLEQGKSRRETNQPIENTKQW